MEEKKRIWSKYQKEIADDHYFYARSCIRQTFFAGSEKAFLDIMSNVLHKDVFDSADVHTCTGIGYHADVVPIETTMTVIARLLALAKEAGYKNYVPSCITSFGLILEVVDTWKHNPQTLEQTRQYLYKATKREFDLPEFIAHPSDIFYKNRDILGQQMKYKLINKQTGQPLKAVDHIGCHYAKVFPDEGFGGAEFPHVLSGMIEAWGGEVIDYPERRHCCGFGFRHYLVPANRAYSCGNTKKKFESMEPYHPDFILTNCPGCPMFLDRWQYTISEMEGKTYDQNGYGIPVLTYEELTGLLLGYDPWKLGLQLHQVQIEPLLNKIGIEYDPEQKFTDAHGNKLPEPQKPRVLKV